MKDYRFHAFPIFMGKMLTIMVILLLAGHALSAQQVFYCTQYQPTLFSFGDFHDYSPPGVTLQLVTGCGAGSGISVTQQPTGFQVTGSQTGRWSFCYRTVSGGHYGPNVEVFIIVTNLDILAVTCAPDGCSISCYDDFEDFPVGGDAYYVNMMPAIVPQPYLINSGGSNTVDILERQEDGNNFLSFRYSLMDGPQELAVLPLSEPIPPGCTAIFSFDAVASPEFPTPNYNGTPTLGIYALNGASCANGFPLLTCGTGPTSLCTNVQANCMTTSIVGNTSTGLPIAVDGVFTPLPTGQLSGLNFTHYGPFTWTNQSANAVTHILIEGYFQALPTNSNTTRFNIDNIHIEKECNEVVTITPTVLTHCANGQAVISYNVCLNSSDNVPVPVTLQATTGSGSFVAGGGFDQNGSANIILTPPNCTTVTLTINTTGLPVGNVINVNLTAAGTALCTDVDQVPGPIKVALEDCSPPEPLTCPCTAANTINITGTTNGKLYSSLNLPAILNASVHHGCIAISGKLIIDQDVTISDCPNIKMQPCAEIVVQAQKHLTMTQNVITGCEKMWRGISVEAFGRLTFQHNEIQDAQYAIKATGSYYAYPQPNGNATTIIEVQHNRFVRNHIGVYVPGPSFSNLAHLPFAYNDFIGQAVTPLLPACDGSLANWSASSGYAGVVSQNINFNVGNSTDVGTTNTFSHLRNGVIGENCWLQVYHASFSNMIGEWLTEGTVPTFASSFGMGVLTNNGFSTVGFSNFNDCGHGIYSNSGALSALKNDMPSVRRGIEISMPFSCNLSENKDIVYKNRGIIGRDLQSGPLSQYFAFAINKNTLRNLDANIDEGEAAIEIRNGNQPNLLNARMSENNIYLDVANTGIFITGTKQWTIDQNYIQYKPFGTISPAGLAIGQNASGRNYLYANHIEDICTAAPAKSRAFNTANSPENTFCCNITSGNRLGFRFFGACGSTAFRTADMTAHETCLEISQSGTIGEQGGLNPVSLVFANHRNWFNTTSGKALHLGNTVGIINSSRFHVLSSTTPDFPELVSTPNFPTTTWFDINGIGNPTCTSCVVPPLVPDSKGKDIDAGDRIVAGVGFGTATPGQRMLQWEGSRNLYDRLRLYPSLHGIESSIDAFYAAGTTGKISAYYLADNLINNLSTLSSSNATAIALAMSQISQAETALNAKLGELATKTNWADSLAVYRQADAILMGANAAVQSLVQNIQTAQRERNIRAQAALPTLSALSAANILEQNRKDMLTAYTQTIGMGNRLLSAAQATTISNIAFQCPEEGDSAVYQAQAIYQLIAAKQFDDAVLCSAREGGEPEHLSLKETGVGFELIPNPADNTVTLVLPEKGLSEKAQITLLSISGQIMLEKQVAIGTNLVQLSLSNLPEGVYFCRMHTGARVVTQKLIISH